MATDVFSFPEGELRGWKLRMLIRAGKVTAEQVAHKLNIRSRILRDITPVVSVSGPGLPAIRGKNLEWAADELEIAGETIVALASTVPRTAQDEANAATVDSLVTALRMIRDEAGADAPPLGVKDHGWCAGVAMSALASVEDLLPGELRDV